MQVVVGTRASFVDIPGPSGALALALAWNLPLYNADGSALSTLTRQRILYDTSSKAPLGGYAYVKYIADGSSTSISIGSLAANTYYCVHQIYNGQWSDSSPEFAKASA